ncbi:MAG: nucleotidyl transferase AbiEii/AbiGii toxin family protein [Chloroflexi bacterium]|nr:nucleotidyl transferase AbiEii/AbiGii toxin family protein [Chloroflexota bacterium]
MTSYANSAAFRRALEDCLRAESLASGTPLLRLRKIVAFDRFLARLLQFQPTQWVLKGGYAIELRLVGKARRTKDIDVLALADHGDIQSSLRGAGQMDLGDWFQFEVQSNPDSSLDEWGSRRFHIRSLLDSRTFEAFHMDVGIGDPIIDPLDYLQGPSILSFTGIQAAVIPCYPVTQQIAVKVHATTRPHSSGESSRVKDFVDLLLLAGVGIIDPERQRNAIRAKFASRNTHPIPEEMPNPPAGWSLPYHLLAAQVSLGYRTLEEANQAIKGFLNPLLRPGNLAQWDPNRWAWSYGPLASR